MNKLGLFLFLLMGLNINILAQEKYIDSLKSLLKTTMPDSSRVMLYNQVFFNYIFFDLDSAYNYGVKTYSLTNKIGFQKGLSTYHNNSGILNRVEGDYPNALENHLKALKINQSIRYQMGIANCFVNIGLVYAAQKKYEIALEYYYKCLKIKALIKDSIGVSYCSRDIGNAYVALKNYPKAIIYYQKSIINATKARPLLIYGGIKSLGIVYRLEGKNNLARQFLNKALPGLEKHDQFMLAEVYNNFGRLDEVDNNLKNASRNYQQAIEQALKYKNKPELKNAYQNLARVYFKQNQANGAYSYLEKYAQLQDSLFNIENSEKMVRLQNSFELKKKQTELNLQNKNEQIQQEKFRRQTILVYSLIAGAVLLLGLIFLLYRNNRQKQRLNEILNRRQQELAEKNEEIYIQKEEIESFNENLELTIVERTRELQIAIENLLQRNDDLEQFSYIVSHQIRAPIASILGLVSILDTSNIQNPETLQILAYLQKTASNIDILIKNLDTILNVRNSLDKTKEVIDLKELMNKIIRGLSIEIQKSEAKIQVDFQSSFQLYAIKSYLFNILNHLIVNAIKFHCPDRRLMINITAYLENQSLVISVQDNGLGIDLSKQTDRYKIFGLYQRLHTHVEGKGLGLYLVKTQVQALNGKIEVESEPNKGATFKIYLPEDIIV